MSTNEGKLERHDAFGVGATDPIREGNAAKIWTWLGNLCKLESLVDFLEKQSHRPSDMVAVEACKALCELNHLSNKDLQSTVAVLQIFLLSSNSISKFAALKIINRLIQNPGRQSLLSNTLEIETVINDNNKSLSCLAISLLLKICKVNQIDDLLKKV